MKILICEDQEMLLTSLKFRLNKRGNEVLTVKDGDEAKAMIKTEMPDCVIADIEMPKTDGIQLLRYVRKNLKSEVPFIMISALEHDEKIHEAFKYGANDFIAKPFKPAELVIRIDRLKSQRKTATA